MSGVDFEVGLGTVGVDHVNLPDSACYPRINGTGAWKREFVTHGRLKLYNFEDKKQIKGRGKWASRDIWVA